MSATKKVTPGPVPLDLPDASDLESVDAAEIAIIRLAAERAITSREALDFTRMLDHRRRIIADRRFAEELEKIEVANKLPRGEH